MRHQFACACAALLLLTTICPIAAADPAKHPNVLFIAIDDLNHWVGHLGRNKQIQTPNIDRLAARGVTFTRAYCAAPLCNPSRAALFSGLRPSTTGVYDNPIDWRKAIPEALTLPSYFRKHGYYVAGAGKIYHGGFDRRSEWDDYFRGGGGTPAPRGDNVGGGGVGGIKFAALDCNDDELPDYRITSWIIDRLGERREQPFLLACGLHKPHMPWNVPRKYFDMYPLDKIELPPVKDDDLSDVPRAGVRMANPDGDHAAILKSGRWKEAVQAYLAAITYTDMNVGRLLDAVDKSPHRDNTIVVLWGDHGWHLGEKHHWRKFSLWEEATRAPLIWSMPGVTKPGGVCERTVDFMSIYPTLCDLCGLAVPAHLEGPSIRALLTDPTAEWDRPALTTFRFQNHALRTDRWRYIRYADGSEELYDESKDPMEWTNLATDPRFADVTTELARWLPKENKASLAAEPGKAAKRAKRAAKNSS
jgi:arylsulfatase A-like enzyme